MFPSSSDFTFFTVVSVMTSALSAFCTVFVCSSESVCMSRFSGIYQIVSVFLSLYEFGEGRSVMVWKISSPATQT